MLGIIFTNSFISLINIGINDFTNPYIAIVISKYIRTTRYIFSFLLFALFTTGFNNQLITIPINNGIKIFYYTPPQMKNYITNYFEKVYTSFDELINDIKNYKND